MALAWLTDKNFCPPPEGEEIPYPLLVNTPEEMARVRVYEHLAHQFLSVNQDLALIASLLT